ncbi:MAG: flagellar protein FliT [Deltaproteobacteria bacterium]|nr:flagellar protein FliT [Deltaproteobacteria bacterium]
MKDISKEYITALKQVLGISIKQKELLSENRLSELLELQQERDALISQIKDYAVQEGSADVKNIIKQILDNDSILMMKMMSSMEDIKQELKSTVGGKKLVRAYK